MDVKETVKTAARIPSGVKATLDTASGVSTAGAEQTGDAGVSVNKQSK